MISNLSPYDRFEEDFEVSGRESAAPQKPARAYSPRYEQRRSKQSGSANGAHRRRNKRGCL